jgi:hypothetical protein
MFIGGWISFSLLQQWLLPQPGAVPITLAPQLRSAPATQPAYWTLALFTILDLRISKAGCDVAINVIGII